jgi:predicted secreted hydrolase
VLSDGSSSAVGNTGAASTDQPSEASNTSGFPTFVRLPADQAAHPSAAIEWWYIAGHLSAHGHNYGFEVQLVSSGVAQIAITDVTAGTYYSQQVVSPPGTFSVSSQHLDVRLADATLSGPMNAMRLTATIPQGRIDLTLNAVGPVMYNNGTGLFPFLGGSSYYYSLPHLRSSGTLTLNGKTSAVTGDSWLDRQWGDWSWGQLDRWTWMAIRLDNGDSLNLWDLFDKQSEQHWATVLYADGSERVVSVDPLANDASHFRTSPTTSQRYAGAWIVEVPSLHLKLTVTAKPVLQEIQVGAPFTPGINEADSRATGTDQGKAVSGEVYVEQFGIWK